jgi:hypothetical protein
MKAFGLVARVSRLPLQVQVLDLVPTAIVMKLEKAPQAHRFAGTCGG